MKYCTLVLLFALAGCGSNSKSSSTPPPTGTNLATKTWQIDLWETTGTLGHLSATLSSGACGSVPGPACFNASTLAVQNGDPAGTPSSLTVGVPANPVPTGSNSSFDFLYVYNVSGVSWNILASGQFFPNGNIAGNWHCDTSPSSACAGLSGTFTAAQQ